jgi:hypothetical protein
MLEAQTQVMQIEHLLGAAIRAALMEAIDIVTCVPEDQANFALLRRAHLLLNAIAKTQENLI